MSHDEIIELCYRAMRDEGLSAQECIERFGGEEIAAQIEALEAPMAFRRSVARPDSAGVRKARMLNQLSGSRRRARLPRLLGGPLRGAGLAAVVAATLGAATVGAANPGGVRDSLGEALGLLTTDTECTQSISEDGAQLCAWGGNYAGQLARPDLEEALTVATGVLTGGEVVQLSAGNSHVLALMDDGSIVAWGDDSMGQLGDGGPLAEADEEILVSDPVRVDLEFLAEGVEVTAVAAGGRHSLALLSDGSVLAWGSDLYGQLGDNQLLDSAATPVRVAGIRGAAAVAAGESHSLALLADGSVAAWGWNVWGQVGAGAGTDSEPVPLTVEGVEAAIAVAAGGFHSLALLEDGTVRAWGKRNAGELGDGGPLPGRERGEIGEDDYRGTPLEVVGLAGVVQIAAGQEHSIALLEDGSMRSWGWDEFGQLGNDDARADQSSPVEVSGLLDVVSIATGLRHSLALLRDGSVRAWGQNIYGEVGDGSSDDRATPVKVSELRDVEALAAGNSYSLAVRRPSERDGQPLIAITKGDWVEVVSDDGCADPSERPPSGAGEGNRRLACPPDGSLLMVVGGPDEVGGERFWAVTGFGWLNERYLRFDHEGPPPGALSEELGILGLIAYVGPDQGLWLMRADGTEAHRINRGPVLGEPLWSPDGRLIAFAGEGRLRIVDIHGAMLVDLPGFIPANSPWSDDSRAVSAVSAGNNDITRSIGMDGIVREPTGGDETRVPGPSDESPDGEFALASRATIVYPEFAPEGVSSWIWVSDLNEESVTILAEGTRPAWQPMVIDEGSARTSIEAVERVVQYYPQAFEGPCDDELASGLCVRDLGTSGQEIAYALEDAASGEQLVLLFVRTEDDGYVVGHLEPALCQGLTPCPPPAGATLAIAVNETCANARSEPGRDAPINSCVGAGVEARFSGNFETIDARLWLELEGLGWVSASFLRCVAGCE